MPMPKPKKDETQDEFIERCMSNEAMKEDYPDNDQRLAVCFQQWKDKDKKSLLSIGQPERRYFGDIEIRLKEPEDGEESNAITGYAAVFNKWSEDLGFFKERIIPGAFKKTISENDIRALINHDPNLIIGRTRNKTLKLWEDDKGLGFECKLPDTSYAKDLRESIKRKDITQNSFGFQTLRDDWSEDGKKRDLIEAKLSDISPVTFPAYKQTIVKMRLQEVGIDYEVLNMALIRADRGVIMDSDVDLIRSTIEILNQYVPDVIAAAPLTEIVEDPEHPAAEEAPELVSTLIRARITNTRIKNILARR